MITAAIYARKSTEQTGTDADAKSVANQIANARAFALSKGWTVPEAHVYADDAISGAEVRKLVNRQRLLDAIDNSAPPFQILIMRDASRFSRRDGDEAFGELKAIAKAGIAIWFYQDAAPFTFGSFGENVVGFVRAEMNAEYRRQIAKWTREAMIRKAQAGHVCGGVTFGYDNVKVDGHTERRINEAEAAVIRRIFTLCADGTGYTRIAKQLNAEHAPAPRPRQQGRPVGWSTSAVYEVLHRPLYRGELIWNKTRKRDAAGKTAITARPEAEWMRFDRPDLRIISDAVWSATQARLGGIRAQISAAMGGRPLGRRRRDIDSAYLLSGFARCGRCGGTLSVLSQRRGTRRLSFYGCLAHAKRGKTICDNALVLPVDRVHDAVLTKLGSDVLRPAVVTAILDVVFAALRPAAITRNVGALKRDLRALETKIANLTAAIENGAALAPIVAQLQARQQEREALLREIGAADAVGQLTIDRQTIERKVLEKLAGWRARLATDGRQVLREVLDGPLRFEPAGKEYRFDGKTTTGAVITSLIGDSTLFGVPNGMQLEEMRSILLRYDGDRREKTEEYRLTRPVPAALAGGTSTRVGFFSMVYSPGEVTETVKTPGQKRFLSDGDRP